MKGGMSEAIGGVMNKEILDLFHIHLAEMSKILQSNINFNKAGLSI